MYVYHLVHTYSCIACHCESCTSIIIADCGAPLPPVNGSLQLDTNTTEGSVVVFQCNPGLVSEGEMTAVCGMDGQWTPNPERVTCSPVPTQTFTQLFTQVSMLTPGSTPTGPGKKVLRSACIT